MNCTIEEVTLRLNKLLTFLEPLHTLANSHLASLFSENLWSTNLPAVIQTELNNRESINNFIDLYPKIATNNCPNEFSKNHPNVTSFVRNALDISVINDKKYSKNLTDLENFFLSKGCSIANEFHLEGFMTKKKQHEVKTSSRLTALLSNFTKSSHIVDVGGGKGYLSSVLSLHHSLKVLGLDSSEVTTCGALKTSEKIAKVWSGGVFEKELQLANITKKAKGELLKEYYKQVNTFVRSDTNVISLLAENFNENIDGVTMTGLHTCGNLASTCLKMFLNNKDIKAILNVGCCYHLISEEFSGNELWEDVNELRKTENYGFPLSKFLRSKNYVLGRNARMLAGHSLEKINFKMELDEFSQTSLLYRAILEVLVKNVRGEVSRQHNVGRLARKCKNFKEYVRRGLEKMEVNIQISDSDLNEIENFYQSKKPDLTAFFLLRVTLAPIIESIVLLDRILYLVENGIENAYLVRLFDLEISPRGFGIIAWKGF